MRALIIGGGGYIGRRLAARLLTDGWETSVLTLPGGASDRPPPGARWVQGDRHEPGLLPRLLARGIDTVFDLVAYRPVDTCSLIGSASSIGRLVHLSSISVYRDYPDAGRASELDMTRHSDASMEYGPSKAACERALEHAWTERGFPSVILRSAPIFGPGDPCSREAYFLKRIISRQPILHPGPAEGLLWILFIDDLIDALLLAANAPDSVCGRAFHLAQREVVSLRSHINRLAGEVGRPVPDLHVAPQDRLVQNGFRIQGFPYARTLAVAPDIGAAQKELLWDTRPHHDAIRALVNGLEVDGIDAMPVWPGRRTTQARLSGAHEWLHSAQESRFLDGASPVKLLDRETQLACLVGTAHADFRFEPVASEDWPKVGGRLGPCVVAPRAWLARLSRSRAPWSESAAGPTFPFAVIEADLWDPELAWLFSGPVPRGAQYGLSCQPLRLRWVQGAVFGGRGAPEGECWLVESNRPVDRLALSIRARKNIMRGRVDVSDLASWARVYVLGSLQSRRLGNGLGNSQAVARLLTLAGFAGSAVVWTPRGPPLPASAALCKIADRWVVADISARRVIEVSSDIAAVLTNGNRHVAVDQRL